MALFSFREIRLSSEWSMFEDRFHSLYCWSGRSIAGTSVRQFDGDLSGNMRFHDTLRVWRHLTVIPVEHYPRSRSVRYFCGASACTRAPLQNAPCVCDSRARQCPPGRNTQSICARACAYVSAYAYVRIRMWNTVCGIFTGIHLRCLDPSGRRLILRARALPRTMANSN